MQKQKKGTRKCPEIQGLVILELATGGQYPPIEEKGK